MKKLINRPEDAVREMLEGFVATEANLALLIDHKVVLRADADQIRDSQIALISGGGSGHEPAHAGYVGAGMLSAAVAGEIFSSPTPDAVLAAIRAVAGNPGVLLIVKNYTGDRLNFGFAAEMARTEGISVEMIIVADDIALAETENYAGARGIAGTVFVHKIAGAAAAEGLALSEVAAIAQTAATDIATMGVALSAGILPATGKPTFVLGDAEIEFGLGIHGEPGVTRAELLAADELARVLVERIATIKRLSPHEPLAVLVNNLGSTTPMELSIFARSVIRAFEERNLQIERVYAGQFMTSLEMAGISVSVLRLTPDRLRLLDAPTSAPAWPHSTAHRPNLAKRILKADKPHAVVSDIPATGHENHKLRTAILASCAALRHAEHYLTELDQAVGDGDLGTNLARGALAVESEIATSRAQSADEILTTVGVTLESTVGGTSGALYGVLFLRAASFLASASGPVTAATWAQVAREACDALSQIGGAVVGDRTMLDALEPFVHRFTTSLDLNAAVDAAEKGAEGTAQMLPRRGRSSYMLQRALGHADPGAIAVSIWLRAVARTISD